MPTKLQKLFTEVSFFEILVEVLIYRRVSRMVIAIVKPFVKANTPEEAKELLKRNGEISQNVYKGIFKKVSWTMQTDKLAWHVGNYEQFPGKSAGNNATEERSERER